MELVEKIANLYSIPPQHIHRVYRQGPTGIHVLVSNEVRLLPAQPPALGLWTWRINPRTLGQKCCSL